MYVYFYINPFFFMNLLSENDAVDLSLYKYAKMQ